MKDGQVIKTAVSVLFKTSSRANAKLRMKTFRNKNIDDILDPDKKLSGIPAGAEIVKVAMGKKSIQDFKDIIDPPEKIQKPEKPKKFSPPKKPAKATPSIKTPARKIIKVERVAKPKNKVDLPITATKVVETNLEGLDAKARLRALLGI